VSSYKIIALMGKAKSGKDTFGEMLLRANPDGARVAFADKLKEICGEMFDLSALAADCATDGRYACLFVSAPLNIPRGVASPPNALAIK